MTHHTCSQPATQPAAQAKAHVQGTDDAATMSLMDLDTEKVTTDGGEG